MTLGVVITDGETGKTIPLGAGGGLATGPVQASLAYNATLDVDNTEVEIVPPEAGKVFCVTGVVLTGNKNIATGTDAVVTLYEADPADINTSVRDILIVPIARSSQTVLTGIVLQTAESVHIMGKTTDDDVLVTILGFYV